MPTRARILIAGLCLMSLTACGATAQRISEIGSGPQLASIEDPTRVEGYQPVSLPMPAPQAEVYEPNSLWRSGSRQFFRDQRASTVGDILTVVISINDDASLSNSTSRSRANSESAGIDNFFGVETALDNVFPSELVSGDLVNLDSATNNLGAGTVDRDEEINLQLAAIITQVLPNGNLVIQGRQQVRVNHELRDLIISGVIRPQDISPTNTVRHDQVAEARITYGGRGIVSDVQQPRYGQQLYDIIFPF